MAPSRSLLALALFILTAACSDGGTSTTGPSADATIRPGYYAGAGPDVLLVGRAGEPLAVLDSDRIRGLASPGGLAWNPTARVLQSVDFETGELFVLDPATRRVARVPLTRRFPQGVGALTFDTLRQRLVAVADDRLLTLGPRGPLDLGTIPPRPGTSRTFIRGLAYDPTRDLLVGTGNQLVHIFPRSRHVRWMANLDLTVGALGWNELRRELIGVEFQPTSFFNPPTTSDLVQVNDLSGYGTLVAELDFSDARGAAYVDGELHMLRAGEWVRFDGRTGAEERMAAIGVRASGEFTSLALDPRTGAHYTFESTRPRLIRVEATGGMATVLGDLPLDLSPLWTAFVPETGLLYLFDQGRLMSFDPETLALQVVGPLDVARGPMCYDAASGELLMASHSERLVSVSTTTAESTFLAPLAEDLSYLASAGPGALIGIAGNQTVSVDRTTGAITVIGPRIGVGGLAGDPRTGRYLTFPILTGPFGNSTRLGVISVDADGGAPAYEWGAHVDGMANAGAGVVFGVVGRTLVRFDAGFATKSVVGAVDEANGELTGLAYDPRDDRLLAVTNSGQVLRVDPLTADAEELATLIAANGLPRRLSAAAFDPGTRTLHVVDPNARRIYSGDPDAGIFGELLGFQLLTFSSSFALTWDEGLQRLIVTDGRDLLSVDPATGASELLDELVLGTGALVQALAAAP